VRPDDVQKDVAAAVSMFYRTDVRGEYVLSVASKMSAPQ
jgi:hypothetical protein